MAKDLELALRITAKDNTQAALGKTRAGLESISRQLTVARNAFLAFQGTMGMQAGLAGLARVADEIQGVNARLKLATGSVQAFAQAQETALRLSAQTGAGYAAIATLYGRLATAAAGYGLTQAQIAATTEATARALQLSGASAAESASVIRQLSQALGSGVLRGEEFNSIMEGGGRLAKALADGLGLPVGRLRELAEQGLLTTDVVVRALETQREAMAREAAAMPRTIGQSLTAVQDAIGQTVVRMNEASGASRVIAGAFNSLARNMDAIAATGAVLAIGALTAALVRGGQAAIAYVAQMIAAARATAGLSMAAAAATATARGLSAAIALIGGPLGAILTALTMGATAWAIWGNRAETAADKAKSAIDRAREAAERLRKEQQFGTGDAGLLREGIAALEQRERLLTESVAKAGSKAAEAELKKVRAELVQRRKDLTDLEAKAVGETVGPTALGRELLGKGFEAHLDQYRRKLDPLAAALRDLREQAQKAGIALTSPEFREAEALVRRALAPKTPKPARTRSTDDTAAAAADLARAKTDAELALLKDGLGRQQTALEAALEDRLVTLRDYYAQKTAIDQREIDAEFNRQRALLAEQQRIASAGKTESERLRAKAEVAKIEANLVVLNNRRTDIAQANARKAAQAERELADALAGVREELAQITGTATDADRRAAIERGYRDLRARLAAEGDAGGVALVDRLIDVKAAQANLQQLETEWRLVTERLRNAQEAIGIQQQAGLLTETQARQQIVALQQQSAAEMERLLPLMQQAAAAIGPEAVARVQAWQNELARTKVVVDEVAVTINGAVQDGFMRMFESVISGAASARDAFRAFALSVIQSIQRIAAQKLAESLFGGFKGGGIGGFFSALFSGKGFAYGGYVTGPGTSTSDSIPARLSAGEYVVRAAAVRQVGVAFLDAVNGLRRSPRFDAGRLAFAAGGLVTQAQMQPAQAQQAVRIVNAIDPGVTHDHLQTPAGERVILNIIGRNAHAVRAVLQG